MSYQVFMKSITLNFSGMVRNLLCLHFYFNRYLFDNFVKINDSLSLVKQLAVEELIRMYYLKFLSVVDLIFVAPLCYISLYRTDFEFVQFFI
jgi:hypothetical protein